MRALFLTESQGWSGGAAQLLALAKGLGGRYGWDVRLASPADGEVAARARHAGIPHIPFHPRKDYDLPSAFRLARLCRDQRVDVLHAHHPRAHAVGLAAMYLARRRPVFLVTRRVSFPLPRNPFSRFKYRSARVDGYAAVAESVRRELLAAGVGPERVRVIHSGVDERRFSPRPRDQALAARLNLPPGVPVIGKVANYGAWKGQDVFLAAAAAFLAGGRRAVFVLAGRDTDCAELKAKAAAAGLADSIRLLGFRTDVPELISLFDVSVNSATAGEGISGAVRESMAMGIPVAASDAGGNAEIVLDGRTGTLFKSGDAAALAAALADAIDRPEEARRRAEEGRRLILAGYSVERMVEATADYYRELLARRGAAGSAASASASALSAESTEIPRQDSHSSDTAA